MWIVSGQSIQSIVYTHTHTPSTWLQSFSVESAFVSATQVFHCHCSVQWCGMAGRLAFSSEQVLLMPDEYSDGLPTHNCCSHVGLEPLLHSIDKYQIPYMYIKVFLTCCLSMIWKWIGCMCTDLQTISKCIQISRLSGNGHACTGGQYRAIFSSLMAWEQG